MALGFPLPKSFPNGPNGAPDGLFGDETFKAVQSFQKQVFPKDFSKWDGRVGDKTLAEMDRRLQGGTAKYLIVYKGVNAIPESLREFVKKRIIKEYEPINVEIDFSEKRASDLRI